MQTELEGQVAVVTGASGTIGTATTRHLAQAGAEVVGLALNEARLRAALADVSTPSGVSATWRSVDVTDPGSVDAAFAAIKDEKGSIDILFNNAGRFHALGGVHESDPEDWWSDVTVNVKGPYLTCRAVLPIMMAQGSGTIINMDGGRPVGGSAYAASKAALVQFTQIIAQELAMLGENSIRVLCANPGLVHSEMTEHQMNSPAGQRWLPEIRQMIEAGQARKPDAIADKTIEMLKSVTVADNGRCYNPDGWMDG